MDPKPIEDRGEAADRREFLKKAGKLAATVPAVALLLSANATPAQASGRYGKGHRKGKVRRSKLAHKVRARRRWHKHD
jgi:hypothetical protein